MCIHQRSARNCTDEACPCASRKYYINDYYQYDAGSYYYQPPYNAYLQLDFT